MPPVKLKRTLSLPLLIFYGLGTIVGAGIYVLIGKVALVSGVLSPLAFLVAGLIACLTAFSYAELSSRFPKSAGAAVYVQEGFGRKLISQIVGYLIVLTGIVSAATIVNGFMGYLNVFVSVPETLTLIALIVVLAVVAAWGIKESAILIMLITLLELGGLVFVLGAGGSSGASWQELMLPALDLASLNAIFLGGFLAFYAFIGFEDMVNVVEEVKNPSKTVPIAILVAVSVSTLLYIAVSLVALRSLPVEALATSSAPLADIVQQSGFSPVWISLISLVAVVNGALVQMIMASRVLYGMGSQGMAAKFFANLSERRQTPVLATVLVAVVIMVFALWLPIVTLAKVTSFIMLSIFALVNVALVAIKWRGSINDHFSVPIVVPVLGALTCLALLVVQVF